MKRILFVFVDDERNIVELLRLYLAQAGYAVADARDGVAAVEAHARWTRTSWCWT